MGKKKDKEKKDRFKIVEDPSEGCFIVDTTGKLASIPLRFRYTILSADNQAKLQEWMTFMNKK